MLKFHDRRGSTGASAHIVAGGLALLVASGCAQGPQASEGPVLTIREMAGLEVESTDSRMEEAPVAEAPEAAAPVAELVSGPPLAGPPLAGPARVIDASVSAADEPEAASAMAAGADEAERLLLASRGLEVEPPAPKSTTPPPIDYFNSNEFNRNFALSFLRRSDVDPPISVDEIEPVQEILELIQKGKKDRAMQKLVRENTKFQSPTYEYTIGQLLFDAARDEEAKDEPNQVEADRLYAEAIPHYEAAIALFGKYLNAEHNLALIHYRLGHYREAAEHFSRELQLGGVDVWTYGLLGDSLMKSELYLPAETAFRNALLLDPFNDSWSLGLTRCLFSQQRYSDTIALVEGLLNQDPDRPELWMSQGGSYLRLGNVEKAAESFRIAHGLGGATAKSLNIVGAIYVNDGLTEMAVESFLESLAQFPGGSPDAALRAADTITKRGDVESAKRLLVGIESAVGDRMDDAQRDQILKLRSKVAVREGNSEDEIATMKAIVDRNPLDGEAVILLAEAYERAEAFEEAAQSYETAAAIDSFEALARRKHGQMLARQRRYSDAVLQLKASLQAEENPVVREFLGEVDRASKRTGR